MNAKLGICKECPPDSKPQPLIQKLCKRHYWQHRAEVSKDKKTNKAKAVKKSELKTYFASEVLKIPQRCDECGDTFHFTQEWQRKAAVCHILPKAIFLSVATHPQNRWFGCLPCHTDFDNRGADYVTGMKMFETIKERVQVLIPLLTHDELRRVPEYYIQIKK